MAKLSLQLSLKTEKLHHLLPPLLQQLLLHLLHKEKGSYPKAETVLSNFWVYWEWILMTELTFADIAFLWAEIPPNAKMRQEVDTARRLLLTLYFYKTDENGPYQNGDHTLYAATKAHVERLRSALPNFAAMDARLLRYQRSAVDNPGLLNMGRLMAYTRFLAWSQENSMKDKHKGLGGVRLRNSGTGRELVKATADYLSEDFLRPYLDLEINDTDQNQVLTVTGIEVQVVEGERDPRVARASERRRVERPVQQQVLPVPADPHLQQKEAAWGMLQNSEVSLDDLTLSRRQLSTLFQQMLRVDLNTVVNGLQGMGISLFPPAQPGEEERFRLGDIRTRLEPLQGVILAATGINLAPFLQERRLPLGELLTSGLEASDRAAQEEREDNRDGQAGLRDLRPSEIAKQTFFVFLDMPNFNGGIDKLRRGLNEQMGDALEEAVREGHHDRMVAQIMEIVRPEEIILNCISAPARRIYDAYRVGTDYPELEYSREPETDYTLDIEIMQDENPVVWENHFKAVDPAAALATKRAAVERYFHNGANAMEQHANEKIVHGAVAAGQELVSKANRSLKVDQIENVRANIAARSGVVQQRTQRVRRDILNFARKYAEPLNLVAYFGDHKRISSQEVIDAILDRYERGRLSVFGDENLQCQFERDITEYLLLTTEQQQLQHAERTLKRIDQHCDRVATRSWTWRTAGRKVLPTQRELDEDFHWISLSIDLRSFLEEGADRNRYARTEEDEDGLEQVALNGRGNATLADSELSRKYLVSDYRHGWITRIKAKDAVEQMLQAENPARFVTVRMGIGKTSFIFPMLARVFVERDKMPVVMTTEELVGQLGDMLGKRFFVFDFDINFGLDQDAASDQVKNYLDTLATNLESLKEEGRYVLTTPARLSSLRNKRIELQDQLRQVDVEQNREEANRIFALLQQMRRIEAFFKSDDIVYLQDEDTNLDVSFEYNFAIGEHTTVDSTRYSMAEKMVRTMLEPPELDTEEDNESLAVLKQRLLTNNLRATGDVKGSLRPLARAIFRDARFWAQVGWKSENYERVNEDEFVAYVLGDREELPVGLEEWESERAEEQKHLPYIAALKTYLSSTFESVYGINPKLDRGVSGEDGCVVVPFLDGTEKKNVQYGEESEIILHHLFHYAANGIGEKVFRPKFDELSPKKDQISEFFPDESWRDWAGRISGVAGEYQIDNYEALAGIGKEGMSKLDLQSMRNKLAIARIQFLRHIMLSTEYVKVYAEQVVCNSQDVTIGSNKSDPGRQLFLASGTGDLFALNLGDPSHDASHEADVITGETLLCLEDLEADVEEFDDAVEHMKRSMRNPNVVAILNHDYEVLGNRAESLVTAFREDPRGKNRQFVFRDVEREKKVWNPNTSYSMDYDPEVVDEKTALFYYGPQDSRGVDFAIPRTDNQYAVAMVGLGTDLDSLNQLLWRQRHLGHGHQARIAIDKRMAARVRRVNSLTEEDHITLGHVIKCVQAKTLKEEEIKHIKAAVFDVQVGLKKVVDQVLHQPYTDLSRFEDIDAVIRFEQELTEVTRSLFVMTRETDWETEYMPRTTVVPLKFLRSQYRAEIRKVELLRLGQEEDPRSGTEFIKGLHHVRAPQQDGCPAKLATLLEECERIQLELAARLEEVERAIWLQTVLEDLEKHGKQSQADAQRASLREEKDAAMRLLDYYNNNLPAHIFQDFDDGMRMQQQTQQQQQQQQQQEQQQQQQNEFQARGYAQHQPPLGYTSFVQPPVLERYQEHDTYEPITRARASYSRVSTNLINRDFENVHISRRSDEVLRQMGIKGPPVFYLLIVRNEVAKSVSAYNSRARRFVDSTETEIETRSVIVTPTEWENTIADGLYTERREGSNTEIILVPLSRERREDGSDGKPQTDEVSLLLDFGSKTLDMNDPEVVRLTTMNKLFLNWTKLRDAERAYLEHYLTGLAPDAYLQLVAFLKDRRADDSADMVVAIHEGEDEAGGA